MARPRLSSSSRSLAGSLAASVVASIAALGLVVGGAGCGDKAKADSIAVANKGVNSLSNGNLESAITEFKEATRLYKENHSAWFHLGEAYRKKKVWPEAVTAYTNAVKYKGSDVMYRLRLGVALYEAAVEKARQAEATRTGKKLEDVEPDLEKVDFDQAQQHLEAAIAGNAGLFNAHYYLGKIHLHRNRPQQAAESFTRSITASPRFQTPYMALINLYREWDYTEEAIQVAAQGIEYVKDVEEKSELHEAQGLVYFDKGDDANAIAAFSKAIELNKDAFRSRFQRGMARFRKGELKAADEDFEAYLKAAGPSQQSFKAMAQKTRNEISMRLQPPAPPATPPRRG